MRTAATPTALAILIAIAGPYGDSHAATAPFNVTGHWVGRARPTTGGVVTLIADFTQAAGASTFTGTVVATGRSTETLDVNGVLGPKNRVRFTLTPLPTDTIGRPGVFRGTLNAKTRTIRGTFQIKDEKHHHGAFKLVESSS